MSEDLKDRLVVNSRLYGGPHPDDRLAYAAFAAVSRARQLMQGASDRVYDAYAGQGAAEAARRGQIRGQYAKEAGAMHMTGVDNGLWLAMSDEQRQQFSADDDAGLVPTNHPLSVARYGMALAKEADETDRELAGWGWSEARRRDYVRDAFGDEAEIEKSSKAHWKADAQSLRHLKAAPPHEVTAAFSALSTNDRAWIEADYAGGFVPTDHPFGPILRAMNEGPGIPPYFDSGWHNQEGFAEVARDHWKADARALRHLKEAVPHEVRAAFNALTTNDRAWLQSDYAGGLVPIDHPFNPMLQAQSEVSRIANYGRDVERPNTVEISARDPNRWLEARDVAGLRQERTYLHAKEMYDDEFNGTRGLTKAEARRVDEIDARLSIHEIALGEYVSWYRAAQETPESHDAYRDAWAKTEDLALEAMEVRPTNHHLAVVRLGTVDELAAEKAALEADRADRAANRLAVIDQRANLEEGLAPQDYWKKLTSSERIKVAMAYVDHPRGEMGWYEGPLKQFDLKAELAGAEQEWARMHPMDRLLQVHDYEAKQAAVVPIARRWADQGPLPAHPFAAQIQREHQAQLDAAKEVARTRTAKETKFEAAGPRLKVVSNRSLER